MNYKDGKIKGGVGQDRTTLRGYSGNVIKQYETRLIKAFWNNQYWGMLFHIVETQGHLSTRPQHNKEVWAIYKTSTDKHRDS